MEYYVLSGNLEGILVVNGWIVLLDFREFSLHEEIVRRGSTLFLWLLWGGYRWLVYEFVRMMTYLTWISLVTF